MSNLSNLSSFISLFSPADSNVRKRNNNNMAKKEMIFFQQATAKSVVSPIARVDNAQTIEEKESSEGFTYLFLMNNYIRFTLKAPNPSMRASLPLTNVNVSVDYENLTERNKFLVDFAKGLPDTKTGVYDGGHGCFRKFCFILYSFNFISKNLFLRTKSDDVEVAKPANKKPKPDPNKKTKPDDSAEAFVANYEVFWPDSKNDNSTSKEAGLSLDGAEEGTISLKDELIDNLIVALGNIPKIGDLLMNSIVLNDNRFGNQMVNYVKYYKAWESHCSSQGSSVQEKEPKMKFQCLIDDVTLRGYELKSLLDDASNPLAVCLGLFEVEQKTKCDILFSHVDNLCGMKVFPSKKRGGSTVKGDDKVIFEKIDKNIDSVKKSFEPLAEVENVMIENVILKACIFIVVSCGDYADKDDVAWAKKTTATYIV